MASGAAKKGGGTGSLSATATGQGFRDGKPGMFVKSAHQWLSSFEPDSGLAFHVGKPVMSDIERGSS